MPPRKASPRKTARRTQAERRADTRARLLHAAIEILRQKGYVGFRVGEVSRRAKVSRGAQTHHFPTKDTLVLAAVEHSFAESEALTRQRVASLQPRQDLVVALIDDGAEYYLGHYFLVALNLLSVGDQAGPFRQAIIASARAHRMRVEQLWLDLLVADGVPAEQAEEAIWVTYDILRGMSVRRFIEENATQRWRRLERLRELARGLLQPARRLGRD